MHLRVGSCSVLKAQAITHTSTLYVVLLYSEYCSKSDGKFGQVFTANCQWISSYKHVIAYSFMPGICSLCSIKGTSSVHSV